MKNPSVPGLRGLLLGFLGASRLGSAQDLPAVCTGQYSYDRGNGQVFYNKTDPDTYDKLMRPGVYSGTNAPEDVRVSFEVWRISGVNQLTQSVSLYGEEVTVWNDTRLAFDSSETGEAACVDGGEPGARWLSLPTVYFDYGKDRRLWVPDVYIENQLSSVRQSPRTLVFEHGIVEHSEVKTITTSCAMNFGQFPFDVQKCPIKYWTYQQSEQDVDLGVRSINDGDGASVVEIRSDASLNSGFFFVLETVEHTEEYEEDTKVLVTTLTIHRTVFPYILGYLLPDLMLMIAVYASFFVNRNVAPARIVLCIIGMLVSYSITNSVRAHLPAVSYPLWINDYLVVSMIFSCLALVEYGLVQHCLQYEGARANVVKRLQSTGLPLVAKIERHAAYRGETFAMVCHHIYERQDNFVKRVRGVSKKQGVVMGFENPMAELELVAPLNEKKLGAEAKSADSPAPEPFSTLEITNVYSVYRIFLSFDKDKSDAIDVFELKQALRHFGYFFSKLQCAEIIHNYHITHPKLSKGRRSMFEQISELEVDFRGLFELLSKPLSPPEDLDRGLMSQPPSLLCDLVMRRAFPCMVLLKILIFGCVLPLYEDYQTTM